MNPDSASDWLLRTLRGEAPPWPYADDPAEAQCMIDLAQREGVAVLCFGGLAGRGDLPPSLVDALRGYAQRYAALEIARELELRRVLDAFAAAGLRPLLMKGTALAYTLYPEPHLRERCDIDLLFPDQPAADRGWELLQDLGYRRANAVTGEFISQEFACHRHDRLGFAHTLDIHWRPSNEVVFRDKLAFDELDRAAQSVAALGSNARVLAPAHALLQACMHRLQHAAEGQANRLIWLYDIHLLMAALSEGEWGEFQRLAIGRGLAGLCLDGIEAAEQAFGASCPAGVAAALAEAAAAEWLTPRSFINARARFLAGLRALPDWSSRVHWLGKQLFPDVAYMLQKYQVGDRRQLSLLYLRRVLDRLERFWRA